MNKHIIRISLVTAAFLLIFAVSTNAFAADTARRHYPGYYPPPPPAAVHANHAPYHNGYGHVPHYGHAPHYAAPPAYYHDHHRYGRPVVTPSGLFLQTPRAGIGIYF